MDHSSGQAGDTATAGQKAGPPPATPWLVSWHGDLADRVDRLGWLRTWSDWLSRVLGPFRERHQDNLAIELLHGGRWVGHPLHRRSATCPSGCGRAWWCWTSRTATRLRGAGWTPRGC